MGVSPRRLRGWEPSTVTVVEYDDAGRPEFYVTVREPEFSAADLIELRLARRAANEPRSSTGYPLTVATDPAFNGKWHAPLPKKDFAAEALNRARKAYEKRYPDADMGSLLWAVELPAGDEEDAAAG